MWGEGDDGGNRYWLKRTKPLRYACRAYTVREDGFSNTMDLGVLVRTRSAQVAVRGSVCLDLPSGQIALWVLDHCIRKYALAA